MIKATLWDVGGVIFTGPFERFAAYEVEHGLPDGFIRRLNATNPDSNAWARLERSEIGFEEFCALFEDEARAAGGTLDASEVMALLHGEVRVEMVDAIKRCRDRGLRTAMLTNNVAASSEAPAELAELFDVVVESSRVGFRKPDPRFYQLACAQLEIEPPEAVFLDDLGVNLKPARELGMTTIKVTDPAAALRELEQVLGFALR